MAGSVHAAQPKPDPESVQEAEEVLCLHNALLGLGFNEHDALELAMADVQVAECLALKRQGCPLKLIARILT